MDTTSVVSPWKLVERLEGTIENSRFAAQHTVQASTPQDDGEFEYALVARVPSLDLVKDGEKPLLVSLSYNVIEVELDVDPESPDSDDDKITVEADDGSFKAPLSGSGNRFRAGLRRQGRLRDADRPEETFPG